MLDAWADIDPERILVKGKLHTLTHTPQHIRNNGPALGFSTEIFECWNAVFRLCSVLSNHQAPSHDIAEAIAHLERFKHQVSGGWWKDSNGQYVSAGGSVRDFMHTNKQLQRRLGWVEALKPVPGTSTNSFSHCQPWNPLIIYPRLC